jgi:hypothetical protein
MQRGWSSFADTRQKNPPNLLDLGHEYFRNFRGSVSAEMAIRSASAGTSTTFGFTSDFCRLCERSGLFGEFSNEPFQNLKLVIARGATDLDEKLVSRGALKSDI